MISIDSSKLVSFVFAEKLRGEPFVSSSVDRNETQTRRSLFHGSQAEDVAAKMLS
jgi:hypothetical protein